MYYLVLLMCKIFQVEKIRLIYITLDIYIHIYSSEYYINDLAEWRTTMTISVSIILLFLI